MKLHNSVSVCASSSRSSEPRLQPSLYFSKRGFWGDARGQGLAEYLIVAVIVAVVLIVALRYWGGSLFGQFKSATDEIKTASAKSSGSTTESEKTSSERSGAPDISGENPAAATSKRSAEAKTIDTGLDQEVSRLHSGVGDADNVNPIDSIEIDWKMLAMIAGIVFAIGVAIVFREKKSKAGGGSNKKKKKFKFFPAKDEDGQAIAEFVLVAITFLFVILGVIQLALCLNAYTLVRYAAYNAARAAIVHSGDEDKMKEAARLSLVSIFPSHGRADTPRGLYENYLGAVATDDFSFLGGFYNEKITQVEIVPRSGRNSGTLVTFDDPVDADKGIITVKVTHWYELVIPLVNRIIFHVYQLNRDGPGYGGQTVNQVSAVTDAKRRSGEYVDEELRIKLVGFYTMRMQSDLMP